MKNLEINFSYLEQCMTNEGHIVFDNKENFEDALRILKSVTIKGEQLFYVERDNQKVNKIFFQLNYFKSLDKEAYFYVGNKKFKFFKYFSLLARRTGAHIPFGKAYYRNFIMDKSIYNHEIKNYILRFFS